METIQLFTAELRYTDETTPVVPPETKRLGMTSGLFVLGTAAAAVVCCFGVSLLVAAGATTVFGLAEVALPAAALIGIGGWTAWYLLRHR